MMKLRVDYPARDEELEIMNRMASGKEPEASAVVPPATVLAARELVTDVYVDEKIKNYILDIVFATREPATFNLELGDLIAYGASPRASIYLSIAARAHAFLRRRAYVTPEDVKAIAMDVLRHRVIITYEAEAEELTSEDIVQRVLDNIEVP
jgi:MoxR-like ATPase